MVYNSRADLMILFGGVVADAPPAPTYVGDTWTYDLETDVWARRNPSFPPSPRAGHAMAYDAQSDRVILIGGITAASPLNNDTWAYDYQTDRWTEMRPALSPPARRYHAMTYDSIADRVLLFGGSGATSQYDDTWAYDLDRNMWTNLEPTSTPPPGFDHDMAFDAESRLGVLFGGFDVFGGMWRYDYGTNTWTSTIPVPEPRGRYLHAMAYDVKSDRVVLFGGHVFVGVNDLHNNETWSYDAEGDRWTDTNPEARPPGRRAHAMAYDEQSERVVLFGGETGTENFADDTWWYRHPPSYPSAPRDLRALAGNGQVTLTWMPPSSDGRSPITASRIFEGTSPDRMSLLVELGTSLAFTHEGLQNGVSHFYKLTAVNAVGESPPSPVASATPEASFYGIPLWLVYVSPVLVASAATGIILWMRRHRSRRPPFS